MGVSNFDKQAATKRLEVRFELRTITGVKKLLEQQHNIRSTAEARGDMASIDMLADLENAIYQAELTTLQARCIELRYNQDLTMTDTALRMGVDTSTASRNTRSALKKIADVYTAWEY
ncbi:MULTISPECIES: sigma factor-like helix-turn-helix DNA-binding protein [Bacillus cereus group]|uniref:sigma factor-like helix-turn-helix DNA-binding protein n=1 Tax=Bacillus cereus group TaxID=86661 RepID=UPI000BEE2484|nr:MULTISPECIES: sigma factor-like helix-turn-helix DNA-binding protein [Bacillus cereus group]PEF88570.1 RNA polymerase subunit sigma-24 [Bacillus thuringiensis]PES54747.1 RNA polymerase subunit sigma-24 [Bacillus thuringiensis]PFP03562.1 RNA polymerase subunit sigma-24 [Bacillus thuringiensis]PFS55703.1 RNA polymerase subunit sigma-24 [Bacillus thuringiensis]PGL62355.1 RNA polymerase subunit sigma-24 [Bacillus thuringiensis]